MLRRRSLQKSLLLVFLTLGLILVCLSILLSLSFSRSFKKDISERNLRLAVSIAGQVEMILDHQVAELWLLLGDIARRGIRDPSTQEMMVRVFDYHPLIARIYLLDREGLVLRIAPDIPYLLGLDMSRQPFFEGPEKERGRIYWSDSYVSSDMGQKTITFSIAYKDGTLAAHLDLNALSEIARSDSPHKKGFTIILDRQGIPITGSGQNTGLDDVSFIDLTSVKHALKGEEGSYEERIGDVKGLSSVYNILETGWVVLIFEPKIGTFGVVDRLLYVALIVLLIALMTAMLISFGLLKKILNTIRVMVGQTRKVASGEYNVSVRAEYTEFAELADSFNIMARSIEAREDDLKRSESRYRELFDKNPLPVMIYDADDLNIMDVSQAAIEEYGFTRDEFMGMSVLDIRPVEDISALKMSVNNRPSGRDKAEILRHRKKDGTVFYVDITSHEIIFLGKKSILAICRNVTSQVLTEEALRESQERLRATLESINDAIIIIDPELNVTWANRSASNSIGYLVGQKCYSSASGASEPCTDCPAIRSLKEEKSYHTVEEMTGPDGLTRTFFVNTAPMYDKWGSVVGVVKSLKDISEMKRSEKLLRESLAEKEILLKEVHHQVKNNLQAISGLISMQSNFSSDLWTKKVLQDSQNRILSIALIYERLYLRDDLKRIDFGEYVHCLVNQLARIFRAEEKGIEFDVLYDEMSLNVETAVPCGLIITELVSNSLKHAFPDNGGGRIKLQLKRKGIDQFVIAMDDNGIGIGDEFEISTNNSLGLNLVRSYVEFLSGTIEVSLKDGAHFKITFTEYEECPIAEL